MSSKGLASRCLALQSGLMPLLLTTDADGSLLGSVLAWRLAREDRPRKLFVLPFSATGKGERNRRRQGQSPAAAEGACSRMEGGRVDRILVEWSGGAKRQNPAQALCLLWANHRPSPCSSLRRTVTEPSLTAKQPCSVYFTYHTASSFSFSFSIPCPPLSPVLFDLRSVLQRAITAFVLSQEHSVASTTHPSA